MAWRSTRRLLDSVVVLVAPDTLVDFHTAVDDGVLVAVRAEGRLLLVRRRGGVDLRVLGEDALEHGALRCT